MYVFAFSLYGITLVKVTSVKLCLIYLITSFHLMSQMSQLNEDNIHYVKRAFDMSSDSNSV